MNKIKKLAFTGATTALLLGNLAGAAFAVEPPGQSVALANSQDCAGGSASIHGAFNFQNIVYGETPSGNSNNYNSSGFGKTGGSGGGQTGLNNSAVCGNR